MQIWQLLLLLITVLIIDFTNPNNLTNDHLILNLLIDCDTLLLSRFHTYIKTWLFKKVYSKSRKSQISQKLKIEKDLI